MRTVETERIEKSLDEAVEATFSASDPISLRVGNGSRSVSNHRPRQWSTLMTDLTMECVDPVTDELRRVLADVFTLYIKTKSFHWHMHGPAFRDYHLLLDEQAEQLFAMTDVVAERARKLGGSTLRSIGDISRSHRLKDQDRDVSDPMEMLAQLRADNLALTRSLRAAHSLCDKASDVATASLMEVWIDEAERRSWFLSGIVGAHRRGN